MLRDSHELLGLWEAAVTAQAMENGTLRCYRGQIRSFFELVGEDGVLTAGEQQLQQHLARLRASGRAHSTINGHFCALASFYGWLEHTGRIAADPVPKFRRYYLRGTRGKMRRQRERRQSITPEQAGAFVASIDEPQLRAMATLLFKTGIRREELCGIDLSAIDWHRNEIEIPLHPKRSQGTVCFDDETGRLLRRWLYFRRLYTNEASGPLFVNSAGNRMIGNALRERFVEAAAKFGIHQKGAPLHRRFTPHCTRHCFTRWLRRAGMPDHIIAHLRGDAESSMVDVYDRLDPEEVRAGYRERMPKLGVA